MIAIMKVDNKIVEFTKFCIVGGLCTVLDACIFYSMRLVTSYLIAVVCGYIISLILNYFLTIFWTFNTRPSRNNALGIIAAHLFNLFFVRVSLMYLFINFLLLDERIAYAPTLLISVVTNFLIVKFIIKKI